MSAQVKAEPPPARSPVTVLQLWKKRPLLCLQACLLEFSKAKIFDHEGLLQQMQDHKAQVEAPPAQEPPPLQEARVVLRPILFIAVAAACVPEGELGRQLQRIGKKNVKSPNQKQWKRNRQQRQRLLRSWIGCSASRFLLLVCRPSSGISCIETLTT